MTWHASCLQKLQRLYSHETARQDPGEKAGRGAGARPAFCGGLLAVDACPHQPQPALPEALWDSVRLSRDEFLSHMAAWPLAPPHAALNALA